MVQNSHQPEDQTHHLILQLTYLPTYLTTFLPTYLPTYLPTCLPYRRCRGSRTSEASPRLPGIALRCRATRPIPATPSAPMPPRRGTRRAPPRRTAQISSSTFTFCVNLVVAWFMISQSRCASSSDMSIFSDALRHLMETIKTMKRSRGSVSHRKKVRNVVVNSTHLSRSPSSMVPVFTS